MVTDQFLTRVRMPIAQTPIEAIEESKKRIEKLIKKLTKEFKQSKDRRLRHAKEKKIEILELILDAYDKMEQ